MDYITTILSAHLDTWILIEMIQLCFKFVIFSVVGIFQILFSRVWTVWRPTLFQVVQSPQAKGFSLLIRNIRAQLSQKKWNNLFENEMDWRWKKKRQITGKHKMSILWINHEKNPIQLIIKKKFEKSPEAKMAKTTIDELEKFTPNNFILSLNIQN